MAKKKKSPSARRIDPTEFGIDLSAIIEEIKPYLEGVPREEVSELSGMTYRSASNTLNGSAKPSLGAVAALAHAAGGRVVVKFEPEDVSRND